MDRRSLALVALTVVGLLVYWYRQRAFSQINEQIREHLPQLERMARDHPDCVPEGVVFDEAHLGTITASAINDFNRNLQLVVAEDKTK